MQRMVLKMMISRKVTILILICSTFLVNGCTQTMRVDPFPLPAASNNSPVSAPAEITVLIKRFHDARAHKDIIGSGAGLIIDTDRQVTQVVEQAIADQLRKDGYEVIMTEDIGNPDIIIEGSVSKYWINFDMINPNAFTDSATVEAKIAVTSRPEPADVPLTTYVGRASISDTFDNPHHVFKVVIRYSVNAALLDMVKAFVGDSRVSGVLNKKYDLKNSRSR